MHSRKVAFLFVTLTVFFTFVASTTFAQDDGRSVAWNRWDVVLDNFDFPANSFDVTEDYEITFNGRFTFGFRTIELRRMDGIRNIQVFEDGRALQEQCGGSPGTYCVSRQGGTIDVRYYFFSPITDASQNFTVSYTVDGAMRAYEGGDQLWWNAVPSSDRDLTVGASTVTVNLPEGYGPREGVDPAAVYGVDGNVQLRGSSVIATATESIGTSQDFEVRVQFPHSGELRVAGWQAAFDRRQELAPLFNLLGGLGGLLLAVGGPLAVFARWYTRGRDPKIGAVPEYITAPPADLPPAVAGTLIDENANTRDVISTLVDLANRGYLVFEETKKDGMFGLGGGSEFTFKRTNKPTSDLYSFEQLMITNIFKGGSKERELSDLKDKFYTTIPKVQNNLYELLVENEYVLSNPKTVRTTWGALGAVGLVGSVVVGVGFGILELDYAGLYCIPMGLFVTSLALIIMARVMPVKTRKGAEEAAKWKAFREYLRNLEKYDDLEEASKLFADYLGYAVAFGLDRTWVNKFENVSTTRIPSWYYPTYIEPYSGGYRAGSAPPSIGDALGGSSGDFSLDDMSSGFSGGLNSMSAGLTDLLNSASSTMTSSPSSSGSSGGFSGGGSSGGSSGGGGGGFG